MERETKLRILVTALPNLLAAFCTTLYSLNVWSLLQLTTVNVLCVFLATLELAYAFKEKINLWKICGFISSGAISGIATALNIHNNIQKEAFDLYQLSFWGWLWFGLLAVSVTSLIIILIRVFCWDQDQWEEIRKLRQGYKKEKLVTQEEFKKIRKEYEKKLAEEKINVKFGKQKDQADKDAEIRNKKHEHQLERLEDRDKYFEEIVSAIMKRAKSLGAFIAIVIMAGLFLIIPYSENLQLIVNSWFDAVIKLASRINVIQQTKEENFFSAFANYVIFYIFLIVAIWLIVFFCKYVYRIVIDRKKEKKKTDYMVEDRNLLIEYDTAIAVLTVFTAVMFALGKSDSPFNDITDKWTILFTVILFILIVFVSIEIVRLVVEQIGQKNSLLKRLIRLIFIAILDFFVGVLLSVILNFKIEKVISSLLFMMFPQDELSFTNKVQEKFNKMFSKELDDGDVTSSPPDFLKKNIWRRYPKK